MNITYNYGSYRLDNALEKAIQLNIKATRIGKSINNVIIAESDKGVYAFVKSKLNLGQCFSVKSREGIWYVDKIILKYK